MISTGVSEPTLLLKEGVSKSNIRRMAAKAKSNGLQFKPHMKTHQSAKIGQWFRDVGVHAITVSSVAMAYYFAENDWEDITIAFPVNICQINLINALAKKVSLTLLVNKPQTAQKLNSGLSSNVNVYIEIDTGGKRSGLSVESLDEIGNLISKIKAYQNLNWTGFYSHPGHSYSARSKKEIQRIHRSVLSQVEVLNHHFKPEESFEICIGDTPCCSVADSFAGIDAISPGNFVFYDLMQWQIGSCGISDIAVAVACPVVDVYKDRKELIIYGGAIHFSKESMGDNNGTHFGILAADEGKNWKLLNNQAQLKKVSQEHGIVNGPPEILEKFDIGDTITILPVHSCLTAHLMGTFLTSKGATINQFSS